MEGGNRMGGLWATQAGGQAGGGIRRGRKNDHTRIDHETGLYNATENNNDKLTYNGGGVEKKRIRFTHSKQTKGGYTLRQLRSWQPGGQNYLANVLLGCHRHRNDRTEGDFYSDRTRMECENSRVAQKVRQQTISKGKEDAGGMALGKYCSWISVTDKNTGDDFRKKQRGPQQQ
eukprot:2602146-Heterocapsa_arctica.AAC.1